MFAKTAAAATILGASASMAAHTLLKELSTQEDLSCTYKIVTDETYFEAFGQVLNCGQALDDIDTDCADTSVSVSLMAPKNMAWGAIEDVAAFCNGTADATLPDTLAGALAFHVVPAVVELDMVDSTMYKPTLFKPEGLLYGEEGQYMTLAAAEGGVTAQGVAISCVDNGENGDDECQAANGRLYTAEEILSAPVLETTSATASGVELLSQLVDALVATELVETIDTTERLTIFAPVNAAFDAVNASALTPEEITPILQGHVVSGALGFSDSLTDGQVLTTLSGEQVTITIADGVVKANDATVVQANVETLNAVVHVIDTVLLPEDSSSSALTVGVYSAALVGVLAALLN